ncbi:hypothetical protein, partial [Streptomyces spiralis]|uniref:hypothetical protein n=1 Tax=Streptomyces spiralis TaxID=66376 RepID=UPI0034048685
APGAAARGAVPAPTKPPATLLRRYEISYRRWHEHRVTKRPRYVAHQVGIFARHLVRLARNRRVDVAWVPGVHAGSVGPNAF